MGDEHHRAPVPLPEIEQNVLELHLGLRIERTERLVHQQYRAVEAEGARERHALPHALAQRLRIGLLEALQADSLEQAPRAVATLLGRYTPDLRAKLGIAESRTPGAQRVARKHVGDVAVAALRRLAAADMRVSLGRPRSVRALQKDPLYVPTAFFTQLRSSSSGLAISSTLSEGL
jgi:hypothetical protein